MTTVRRSALRLAVSCASVAVFAQGAGQPDWSRLEGETMQHFQALLRLDTSNPPGNEKLATDYLEQAFEREGIPVQVYALDADRPNLVARIKGNGRKQPILLMGHTDVVTVDPRKWTFPPFSATQADGYVYGRGSLDDKPHVVAGLMTLLMLKRLNVPLDRDVIFLAESGEEGTSRVGVDYMVAQHFADISAEYCLAEGGGVTRIGSRPAYGSIQTIEKLPRPIELTAQGTSGHASRPLQDNAVVHLSAAVAAVGAWRAPVQLSETTIEYFKRLADVSSPQEAEHYRAILEPNSRQAQAADDFLVANQPGLAAMLRTTISPTMITGGYRVNVIPSEAKATLDVRMLPGEDADQFLQTVRKVINDPTINVAFSRAVDARPPTRGSARLDTEVFRTLETEVKRHYGTPTLPTLGAGATDMAQVRAKGLQCYGTGPATDREDAVKGFGAHSDQERILESELHRFVSFQWDVVNDLARAR
jgi:acetylornithine deacetylase/succinyl-diaminopimelate desuccinylase-like protein